MSKPPLIDALAFGRIEDELHRLRREDEPDEPADGQQHERGDQLNAVLAEPRPTVADHRASA